MALAMPAQAADLVAVEWGKQQETITLHVKKTTPHKVFTVPDPDRLVVDVPTVGGKPKAELPGNYKGNLIKNVRYGQFNPTTSRFVFDLDEPVTVLGIDADEQKGGSLSIDIAPLSSGSAKKPEIKKAAAVPAPKSEHVLKLPETKEPIKTAQSDEPKIEAKTEPKVKPKKEKKSKAAKKDIKPVIVIDAGHGGVDPGAKGAAGSFEKDIVLEYAKALKARLLKSGKYRVMLTRETDVFIMLRQRVAIARKAGASLFISLHADSAPGEEARGLSIYTVSEKASDEEAEALAARENKSDVIAGIDLSDEREDVAGILISLAERDTKNRSASLAGDLVASLDDRVRLLPNSHRFAGFAVLKAPDIPSVLIEIGFLSNPAEEKMIRTKAHRDKVVAGIAAGIDDYFADQP